VNASVDVPQYLDEKCTLLHRASYCDQVEVVKIIVNRGAEINNRSANNNAALFTCLQPQVVWILSSYNWMKEFRWSL